MHGTSVAALRSRCQKAIATRERNVRPTVTVRKSSLDKEMNVSVKRSRVAVTRVGFALLVGILLMTAEGETGILDASWTAPTTNTDGGPLTDLASFRLYYGTTASPCPGASFLRIESPTSTPASGQTMSARLTGLISGSRYFASVSAVDTTGNESACSTTEDAVARDDFGGAV